MTLYLGIVSCDLHKCATRVRVSIPGTDDIPLSVKAVLNNFPRKLFKKGAVVEVERHQFDGRMFRVTEVFTAMEKSSEAVNLTFSVKVQDADALKRSKAMLKGSKTVENRVRFFVGYRYLQNNAIYPVLRQALGIDDSVARELYRRQADGFWVISREDQFARFMIYRNNAGIQNGFMDLRADIIPACGDVYERLAKATGVNRGDVKRILLALNYDRVTVEERLEMGTAEVDVSGNR